MFNRYRDLEKVPDGKRFDVLLMAAVSGFEDLSRPSRHDMKQFSELFAPLFRQAGDDAKRTAVAALSRLAQMPTDTVRLIASEGIDVCAPFLVHSTALEDTTLERIVEAGGAQQARAIARRKQLSPRIVAALVRSGDGAVIRSLKIRRLLSDDAVAKAESAGGTIDETGDESLRRQLRNLVDKRHRAQQGGRLNEPLSALTADRLRRFAEAREPVYFTTALADALHSSFEMTERIMLDVSGTQLAETLMAIDVDRKTAAAALEAFFPHLRGTADGARLSASLIGRVDALRARQRLALWLRADRIDAPHIPEHVAFEVDARPGKAHAPAERTHPHHPGERAERPNLKRA